MTVRVYEHKGVLHIRDGSNSSAVELEKNRVDQARELLENLHKKGEVRFITLRTILEEN